MNFKPLSGPAPERFEGERAIAKGHQAFVPVLVAIAAGLILAGSVSARVTEPWTTTRIHAANDLATRLPGISTVTCAPDTTGATRVLGATRNWQRFWCSGSTYFGRAFRLSYAVTGACHACWTFSHLSGVGVTALKAEIDVPGDTRADAVQDVTARFHNVATVACTPDATSVRQVIGGTRYWHRFWCSGSTYGGSAFRLRYADTGNCGACWTFSDLTGVGVEALKVASHVPGSTRSIAVQDVTARFHNIAAVACLSDATGATGVIGGTRYSQRFWCSGRTYGGVAFRLRYVTTGACDACWTFSNVTGVGTATLEAHPPNPLKTVTLSPATNIVGATFVLPPSMVAYALRFRTTVGPGIPQNYTESLLPNSSNGGTTAASWTSTSAFGVTLRALGGAAWTVNLEYAPRATCAGVGRCPRVHASPPVTLKTGALGPGTLIGQSSASGEYETASIAGAVTGSTANTITVRVSSIPSGQSVHIDWDIACTRGASAQSASGEWDDTTPVNDSSQIMSPVSNPDSCIVSVGASGTDGTAGGISLAVYGTSYVCSDATPVCIP